MTCVFRNVICMRINYILLLMGLALLVSSFLNRRGIYRSRNYVLSCIVYMTGIFEVFFVLEFFALKGKLNIVYKYFYYTCLIVNIINDLLMVFKPELYINSRVYFLGTKFAVSYSHIFMLVFYELNRYRKNRRRKFTVGFMALVVLSAYVIIKTDCMSGVVGYAVVVLFLVLSWRGSYQLYNPEIYFLIIFASTLFVVTYTFILNIGVVGKLISGILKTDLELTGRAWVYSRIIGILSNKPILGNGYGSSYDIMMNSVAGLRAPNTQNGLCEWILEGGILTTTIFLTLIWKIFRCIKSNSIGWETHFPCAILYMFALLASVEVTLNRSYYFCWLALFFVPQLEHYNSLEGDSV